MENKEIILQMNNINKSFPGVLALQDAGLTVYKGTALALLGENGAGKSTLVKILSGVYKADSGEIIYEGRRVSFPDTRTSAECGIAMIHQELNLISTLTVADNLFLGREIKTSFGRIDKKAIRRKSKELLAKVNLDIDPDTPVKDLSIGICQMIEIAKSLTVNAKIIVMDEPTSSLVDKDAARLFELIRQLKNEGRAIIYISHRLHEIFEICDEVLVMRDGRRIAQYLVSEANEERLIEDIAGRKMDKSYPYIETVRQKPVLEFKNISNDKIKDCSGCFYGGLITGLSGLVGSGRTEIAKTLFGVYPINAGKIFIDGKEMRIKNPKDALEKGIVYLSEDRKGDGLILSMSVSDNVTLSALKAFEGLMFFLNGKKEADKVGAYISKLHIKTPSIRQIIKNLSGGNQQKAAIARALEVKPRLLILDEPTRGIDVGAKREIYDLMNSLKQEGLAIAMISSDLNEILGLSDIVMVFREGKISAAIDRKEVSAQKVMQHAVVG
jgi:ribose transport system ATP-binding protein